MHKQQIRLTTNAWQFAEKFPAFFGPFTRFKLLPRPKDRSFGPGIEAFGIEQCPLVVVAQDDNLAIPNSVDALARVRAVANDVAETVNLLNSLRLDIREDRVEGFQVSMNVADDGSQNRLRDKNIRLGVKSG